MTARERGASLRAEHGTPEKRTVAYVLELTLSHDPQSAVQGAWFSELFATGTRTSGASIGCQVSSAITGFVPFAATAAALTFGWPGVALLIVAMALVGLVASVVTRETWGAAERSRLDALVSGRSGARHEPAA